MYIIKTLIHTNKTKETGCGLTEGVGVRGCGRQAGRPGSFGPGHVRPSLPPRQLRGPARPRAGSSRGTGNGGGTRKRGPGPSALIPSTTGARTAPGVPLPGVPAPRRVPTAVLRGSGVGRGAAPLGVLRSERPLASKRTVLPPDLIHSGECAWRMGKKACDPSGPMPEASCQVRRAKHPFISCTCTRLLVNRPSG